MKLVFIHGPVASGKLTVARHLARITGFALFHNHLIVDAVGAVFPFGSAQFVALRERFWLATFIEAAKSERSLIFTFAPESTVAPDFPQRVQSAVNAHGGTVYFVRLTLNIQEQERRIADPSRHQHGKLTSLDMLRELRSMFDAANAAMPEPDLSIDTGIVSPDMAASTIAAALG
jgi:hypothetical protein